MSFPSISTQSYVSHTEARNKIDEEIAQLEARLAFLKLERNTLAPVSWLHTDILQDIFFLVHHTSHHRGKGTLLTTWISHSWRELAHNTANLWSHIDFTNPEWIQSALSHTKDSELEFNLDGTATNQAVRDLSAAIPHTLGNLSRIRRLKVRSTPGMTLDTAPIPLNTPEWRIPAPYLLELDLHTINLPLDVFSQTFPSLQSLYLAHCSFEWDRLPVTRSLKNLTVRYPTSYTTADNMIKILRLAGQSLETLELHTAFAAASSGGPLDPPRLHFSNLKSFKIKQLGEELTLFLDHISLPHYLDLDIRTGRVVKPNIIQALISARGIGRWPVHTVGIESKNFAVILHAVEQWEEYESSPSHIRIEITRKDPSDLLGNINLLPIHPIERVSLISAPDESQRDSILDYFGKSSTIEELRVEPPFLESFLQSVRQQVNIIKSTVNADDHHLTDASDQEKYARLHPLITFPGLRRLDIGNSAPSCYYRRFESYEPENVYMLHFREWLEWKKEMGQQVERLTISGFTTSISGMHGLFDGVVGEFQWNQVESGEA